MAKNSIAFALGGPRTDPDFGLVQAMAAGNVDALNSLYARYGTTLLLYLTSTTGDRQLAEEVLQDVMLTAWNGAANFRGHSSVKTWLLAIARYQAINARTRRQPPPALPLEPETGDRRADPQRLAEQHLAGSELQAAILQLPAEQRETLELLFYQDLSQAEVAMVMKVAPGTVKSRLSRARASLRRLLKSTEEVVP